jgi:hypothetical protein
MQLARLDTWTWPADGVHVQMLRHLSGKYRSVFVLFAAPARAYMDNEIIDALLFQHIGIQWSIACKNAFQTFAKSRAWKKATPPLARNQIARRKAYLPDVNNSGIEDQRSRFQFDQFFLTQLPSEIQDETSYDGDEVSYDEPANSGNQGQYSQQVLLRLVSTESYLHRALHGSCTIMRADLEWFGPSLPHDSVIAVMKYFGIPNVWLNFFTGWLSANLRFEGQSQPCTRERGVPIAHAISVFCGEIVLFGMDFAANQRAGGLYLYRIYDDFWFFSHDTSSCANAWREMARYADLVGISFNMKKTGGACTGGTLDPSLPKGTVGWGFLVFDSSNGRFVVDQVAVNFHIAELKRQLAATKSIFGYVNALSKVRFRFFMSLSFPTASLVPGVLPKELCAAGKRGFGQDHVDDVVTTFSRICREVFSETDGSVIKYIQSKIAERFHIADVPSGWCYIPIYQGGLGLINPIVDFLKHSC